VETVKRGSKEDTVFSALGFVDSRFFVAPLVLKTDQSSISFISLQ
jgi:hypothetical protein